jgi:hypothetical protein
VGTGHQRPQHQHVEEGLTEDLSAQLEQIAGKEPLSRRPEDGDDDQQHHEGQAPLEGPIGQPAEQQHADDQRQHADRPGRGQGAKGQEVEPGEDERVQRSEVGEGNAPVEQHRLVGMVEAGAVVEGGGEAPAGEEVGCRAEVAGTVGGEEG